MHVLLLVVALHLSIAAHSVQPQSLLHPGSMPLVTAIIQSVRPQSLFQPGSIPIVPADAFQTLGTTISTILTEIYTTLKSIAPVMAGMGFVMIGILYVGAPLPVIKTFKESNPQMFSNAIVGIFIMLAASVLVTIIPTS
jgi:hypothetical protein